MHKELLAVPVLLSLGFSAFAHDYSRDYKITFTPYAYMYNTDLTMDSSKGSSSAEGNLFDDMSDSDKWLVGAAALTVEKGLWYADFHVEFTDYEHEEKVEIGKVYSEESFINAHLQAGKIVKRFHRGSMGYNLYALGGVQYLSMDTAAKLTSSATGEVTHAKTPSYNFWTPTIGVRFTGEHNNGFYFSSSVSAGYDFSSNYTAEAQFLAGYKFNENWSSFAGYQVQNHKFTDLDLGFEDYEFDTLIHGAFVGFSYSF